MCQSIVVLFLSTAGTTLDNMVIKTVLHSGLLDRGLVVQSLLKNNIIDIFTC